MRIGDWSSDVCSSDLAVETGEAGLAAPLRLAEIPERLDGAIAVVRLPFRRWSSLVDRAVREPLADALARGANGVILITTGPTGEALLLNVPAGHTVSDKPLALLAPRLAPPVIEAARHGAAANLALPGRA